MDEGLRYIGGQRFILVKTTGTRKKANKVANIIRKKGRNARVIERPLLMGWGSTFLVYQGKKRK